MYFHPSIPADMVLSSHKLAQCLLGTFFAACDCCMTSFLPVLIDSSWYHSVVIVKNAVMLYNPAREM